MQQKGAHVEVYWCVVKKASCVTLKKCLYSTYSSFLVTNVCNQGKTLCSPCIIAGHLLLTLLGNNRLSIRHTVLTILIAAKTFLLTPPDRPVRSTEPPVQWVLGHYQEVRRPGRGIIHPPTSSVKVNVRVQLYIYSSSVSAWHALGWLTFTGGTQLPLPVSSHTRL